MEGILEQITRVTKISEEYKSLPKNAGMFAATCMDQDVAKAKKAIVEMDTVQMINIFKQLSTWES